MSLSGYIGPTCPACTLPAITELGPLVETFALGTMDMNALDWNISIHSYSNAICASYWLIFGSTGRLVGQMNHNGMLYERMCENGNWWPLAFPRRTMYTLFADLGGYSS